MAWTFWGMILLFLAWLAHGALLDARSREKKKDTHDKEKR